MCHGTTHARFRRPAAVGEAGSAAEVQHVLSRSSQKGRAGTAVRGLGLTAMRGRRPAILETLPGR